MSHSPQIPLDFDFRPAMSGEDFLVSATNAQAVAWLDRWPDWPAPFIVIYGEAGCGKSHLAAVFRQATGAHDLNVMLDPYEAMQGVNAGIIEDADQLVATHQQELFHLYNYAKENGAHILLTARKAPAEWAVGLADLKSRLGAVPVVEIGAPDDALMEAVLVKLFSDRQLKIDRDVIAYMLARMERSFEQARKLVHDIDAFALSEKRAITIPLVRQVMEP